MRNMENITKQAIKARAAKLWEIADTLHQLRRYGYYLMDDTSYDWKNHKHYQGCYDYSIEYTTENGNYRTHYHDLTKETTPVCGSARDGGDLIETVDPIIKSALEAFGQDRLLYEIFKASDIGYDEKMRIRVDRCISPMVYETYTDGYYEEITFTLNRKGQVFESKPRGYSRSVLVALGID